MEMAAARSLGWLRAAAFFILSVAFAWQARAADSGLFAMEWSEVAPGVHVGNRSDALRYPVLANAVIVLGPEGALIFDGGGFPVQGEAVLAKLKSLTEKPLLYVVVSHWHGDHNRGIAPLLAAFPDVAVVSTGFTKAAMKSPLLQKLTKAEKEGGAKDTADAIAVSLKDGKAIDGSPVTTAEERAYWERFIADNAAHLKQIEAMRIDLPTLTFDHLLSLDVGGRAVSLIRFGRGNTAGDAVLHVPDAGVVAAGDLIVEPIPYGFGSYPREWADVLRQVKALGATIVVPGHGAIQRDAAYVDLLIETLENVADQVDTEIAAGKGEIKDVTVDFSAVEPRFTGGDAMRRFFFGFFFKQPIVRSAWNVAKGIENENLTEDPPREEAPH